MIAIINIYPCLVKQCCFV